MRRLFVLSVLLTTPLATGHMFHLHPFSDPWVQLALATPVQFIVGHVFYTGAYRSLKGRNLNMDVLVALGSSVAYFYSLLLLLGKAPGDSIYFESSAMLITFIFLGRLLEESARDRTKGSIKRLMGLQPTMATVLIARKPRSGDKKSRNGECGDRECGADHSKGDVEHLKHVPGGKDDAKVRYKEKKVPVATIEVGDLFIVKPGERIPLDGIVDHGRSEVDESMLTGESRPVGKERGSEVFAGTICMNGSLRVKVTKIIADTALRNIIKAVEEAQGSQAPIQRYADRVSNVFIPIVLALATATFLFWALIGGGLIDGDPTEFAIIAAVATLIIACPCAMGLATPTAIMVGTGKGAEHGILIKGGAILEKLAKVDTVVFDKTGTLTMGRQTVTDIVTVDGITEKDLLTLAASIEKGSEHSIGKAIVERAEADGIEMRETRNFYAAAGLGVRGDVIMEGAERGVLTVVIGNTEYIGKGGVKTDDLKERAGELQKEGKTVIFISRDSKIAGLMAIADVLKPRARKVINALHELGIDTYMMTGDEPRTANAIAKKANIKTVMAGVLPLDKASKIKRMHAEGRTVAMVGDGINDAPALARADVGIAIGSGTDIAIESADVVLTNDDLRGVVGAVRLSRRTFSKIKQNLFWALIYNVAAIPIAMGLLYPFLGVQLKPEIAAFAMAMSDVCVVGNSLTLRGFHPLRRKW